MSTAAVQLPIYKLLCDEPGCRVEFVTESAYARMSPRGVQLAAARDAGWDVPPPRGKGSRSREDFCPEHKRREAWL